MFGWCVMALAEYRATIYTRTIILVVFVPRNPRLQTCLARSPAAPTRHPVARIAPHIQHMDGMHELSSGVAQSGVGGSCPSAGQQPPHFAPVWSQRTAVLGTTNVLFSAVNVMLHVILVYMSCVHVSRAVVCHGSRCVCAHTDARGPSLRCVGTSRDYLGATSAATADQRLQRK